MKKLKLGLIGCGSMMGTHVKGVLQLDNVEIVAVCDIIEENAKKVAEFLNNHPMVEWVKHPSLESDPYHALAMKYMPKGQGGMMSFGVKGGSEKAAEFMEKLEMISIVTHVADARSCVLHPASTTHRQLSKEDLEAIGIADNLIRLSVGIENVEDIIADLEQAFAKID